MADRTSKKPKLPEGLVQRVKLLVGELESAERADLDRTPGGEIELKINEDEALWYVAYKTSVA